jgi:hypothetical protein
MASGTVRDKSTLQPIDSAYVKVLSGDMEVYTDSAGAFDVHNHFGLCMPCKDISIEVSKQGYKTQKLINPGNADILLDSL